MTPKGILDRIQDNQLIVDRRFLEARDALLKQLNLLLDTIWGVTVISSK
jgi:hypothetical protein